MIPRVFRTDILQLSKRDGRVLQAVQHLSYTTECLRTLAISQVDLLYDSQNIDLFNYAHLYSFPGNQNSLLLLCLQFMCIATLYCKSTRYKFART